MFDKKKIKDVAQLAMIAVDDNDLSYFSSEILEFLKTVEQMDTINLSEITPLYHAPEMSLKGREDEVDSDAKNDGINCSLNHDGKYFIVPKVID
jgi:aspartyl/glutamyl-tRNA(Asn/Gln) amidotransferase C subunit|tara:strand:- start:331 stop:612 length:282 start_codon:yes stop_codon:yes gene_type:complete